MSAILQKMLEDKQNYPDTHRVALGGGAEVTVGELRTAWAAEKAEVTRRQEELNARFTAVEKAQKEASDLYASVVALQERMGGGAPPPQPNNNNQPGGAPPAGDDPFAQFYEEGPVGSLAKFMRQREMMLAQGFAALFKGLQETQRMMHQRGYQYDYDSVLPDIRDEKGNAPTVAALVKLASEEKLLDEFNVPSIRRAAAKIKSERKAAADAQRRYEEGLAEGKKQAQAAGPAAPSGGPKDQPLFRTREPITLDRRDPFGGAIGDALKDPEIWANVQLPN